MRQKNRWRGRRDGSVKAQTKRAESRDEKKAIGANKNGKSREKSRIRKRWPTAPLNAKQTHRGACSAPKKCKNAQVLTELGPKSTAPEKSARAITFMKKVRSNLHARERTKDRRKKRKRVVKPRRSLQESQPQRPLRQTDDRATGQDGELGERNQRKVTTP